MSKKYYLEIAKERLGYTEFEYADTPMGVVHGKIVFDQIKFPYEFFKNYCVAHNVQINTDDPHEHFIDTVVIPQLKVFLENGEELLGWCAAITVMEPDDFEIQFGGVSTELMQTEFEHHYREYYGK